MEVTQYFSEDAEVDLALGDRNLLCIRSFADGLGACGGETTAPDDPAAIVNEVV